MERVLRLSILRRNQGLKAARRASKKKFKNDWAGYEQHLKARDVAMNEAVRRERKNRREDYICGPLAPRRDVGKERGVYGSLKDSLAERPTLPSSVILRGVRRLFADGDRVVVVNGKEKGKIGKIKTVNWDSNSVTVDGINTADVEVPRFNPLAKQSRRRYASMDIAMPLEDVRLVVPLTDDETGIKRDVVVRHMHGGPPFIPRDHTSTLPRHTRYISGLDLPIEWPEEEPESLQDEEGDMSRLDVEEITQIHGLLASPLPPGVEDELRNKYKREQTRFDEEFMGRKVLQDAERHWRQNRKLQTPQQEFHEMQKKEKQRQGGPELTQETLDIIRQTQAMTLA